MSATVPLLSDTAVYYRRTLCCCDLIFVRLISAIFSPFWYKYIFFSFTIHSTFYSKPFNNQLSSTDNSPIHCSWWSPLRRVQLGQRSFFFFFFFSIRKIEEAICVFKLQILLHGSHVFRFWRTSQKICSFPLWKAKTSECEWFSGCCSGYRLSLWCRCGEQCCLLKDFCINGKQIQNMCEYSNEAKESSLTPQKVV